MSAVPARKSQPKQVEPQQVAEQIWDFYASRGLPAEAAYAAIGEFYRNLGQGGDSSSPTADLGRSRPGKPVLGLVKGKPAMRDGSRGHGKRLTRFEVPEGDKLVDRIARGLNRWREARKLTIPVAADRYKLDERAWYRIERGSHPATTIGRIDEICERLGIDVADLIAEAK